MNLDIKLGQTVVDRIDGHSAINGAPIPANSVLVATSNDPAVATVPASTTVASDTPSLDIPVTVLAQGSTDIHVVCTTPDGSVFETTATLLVNPAPLPGLVSISSTLIAQ